MIENPQGGDMVRLSDEAVKDGIRRGSSKAHGKVVRIGEGGHPIIWVLWNGCQAPRKHWPWHLERIK